MFCRRRNFDCLPERIDKIILCRAFVKGHCKPDTLRVTTKEDFGTAIEAVQERHGKAFTER